MTSLLRFGAAVVAVLLSVIAAHLVASVHSAVPAIAEAEVAEAPDAPGFEVLSITGAPPIGAELLRLFAARALNTYKVEGSYSIDVTVRVGELDDEQKSVAVSLSWYLRVSHGEVLGVVVQTERILLHDLNNLPELVWAPAARAAAGVIAQNAQAWENRKTRS